MKPWASTGLRGFVKVASQGYLMLLQQGFHGQGQLEAFILIFLSLMDNRLDSENWETFPILKGRAASAAQNNSDL